LRCHASVADQILEKNKANPVMIYSKSYCPYCGQMKSLFLDDLKVDAKFAELDQLGALSVVQLIQIVQ
jgi:thioredoxin-related protein